VKSDHPLEVARSQLEAVAPLVSGDPEATLEDLIAAHKQDLDELSESGVLRRAAREVAIATALVAKAIQNRTTAAFNMTEVMPALLSMGACLAALPGAFDQAINLEVVDRRSNSFRTKA
jgi:hypothetical protein